jgi:uncharacterized protein (DUF983 family)
VCDFAPAVFRQERGEALAAFLPPIGDTSVDLKPTQNLRFGSQPLRNTESEVALAILAAFGVLGILSLMSVYLIIAMTWEQSPRRSRQPKTNEKFCPVSGWILARRALFLRCPACGLGRIFNSRFRMNNRCPQCGNLFWKNEGEWLGPAVIDYTVATAGALVAWAALVFLGLSEAEQIIGATAAALIGAIALSRWSRSFWTLLLYISGDMDGEQFKPKES